ncbi:hypothetical protein OW763_14855 [Clostridium aestuarii]|uniref:Transmembrane protein n=1 Tax=Clostridium aestuarii TaxID=338193 RepID=A0ABT4D301_9CLOT|nr:hypothetical protein [Clostridium aestuarii]MCY6485612.1 hypothetical protein [Clostridium aestuarii]
MNINKAIRKQRKLFKSFLLSMSFIFFILPIISISTGSLNAFFLIYLTTIQILIVIAVIKRVNKENLKFKYNNKIKIESGILKNRYTILCDKVNIVHTINKEKDLKIIMILSSRFRNKKINKIDSKFLKKYTCMKKYYHNLKCEKHSEKYYYLVINKGGYSKYQLLDMIYRYCVQAYFTEEAIENIKEYRN